MKTQTHYGYLLLVVMTLICSITVWAAPVGTAFTYQGRLLDDNVAADGVYDMQFLLYDDPNAVTGTQIGTTMTVDDVEVVDGYFIVELDFGSAVFDGDARWLEIAIRPGAETGDYAALSPLQPITPAPYALTDADWTISGDDLYSAVSGNVGIGTTSPVARLEILNPTWSNIVKLGSTGTTNRLILSSGSVWASLSGSDSNRDDIVIQHESGNIGIGTTNPTSKLHVEGTIEVDDTIQADDSSGLKLATDEGTIRLTVNDNGNVGIGTTSPTAKFDVQNSSVLVSGHFRNSGASGVSYGLNVLANGSGGTTHYAGRFQASGATTNYCIYADGANSKSYFGGDVGIGTLSPNYKLHVVGSIAYTGSIYDVSDVRLKENIAPLENGIEKISALKGIYFNNKDRMSAGREVGVIAQDVEQVLPELVSTDEDGYKSVDYTKLSAVLIEAVKEQQQQIEAMQAEIEKLKKQMKE